MLVYHEAGTSYYYQSLRHLNKQWHMHCGAITSGPAFKMYSEKPREIIVDC